VLRRIFLASGARSAKAAPAVAHGLSPDTALLFLLLYL